MNPADPLPQSGSSAQALANLLKRRECIWIASPSLALLSVFIAGKGRPKRVFLHPDGPTFAENVSKVAGVAPELAALDESESGPLRAALGALGADSGRTFAVATHRLHALAPNEWFAMFESYGVPTVELCAGGLFQLARRGPTGAVVTIVDLDAEPAFRGVRLCALLADDSEFVERVRQRCLPDVGAEDCVLDATPRGVEGDEPGLQTLIERAIACDHAQWAAEQAAAATPLRGGRAFSLIWNRLFHSGSPRPSEESEAAPPSEVGTAIRGQSQWLARIAEVEEEHRQTLAQMTADLESIRADSLDSGERLKAEIDAWKARFASAEASLASFREREVRLESDLAARRLESAAQVSTLKSAIDRAETVGADLRREKAELQLGLARESQRSDELARERVLAEERRAAQAVEAKQREDQLRSRLEWDIELVTKARDEFETRLKDEVSGRDRDAGRLLALEEAHRQERRLAEENTELREREQAAEAARLGAALAEWQTRFKLTAEATATEVDRLQAEHGARVARFQEEAAQMRGQADALASELARQAVTHDQKLAAVESARATLAADRDDLASRLKRAEEFHSQTQEAAEARIAILERDKIDLTAQLKAAVVDGQERLDAAMKAAPRERMGIETRHAEVVAGLQEKLAEAAVASERAARDSALAVEALRERVSLIERERLAVVAERDQIEARLRQQADSHREALRSFEERAARALGEKDEETARLRSRLAETELRFDSAAESHVAGTSALSERLNTLARENAAGAAEARRREQELMGQLSRAVESIEQSRSQAATAARDYVAQTLTLGERLAGLERDIATVSGDRDRVEARLRQAEASHAETLRRAEDLAIAGQRERAEELSRLSGAVGEWQSRFEAATKAHGEEAGLLAERLSAAEREKAALALERTEIAARLSQVEERHREALGLAQTRQSKLEASLKATEARLAAVPQPLKAGSDGVETGQGIVNRLRPISPASVNAPGNLRPPLSSQRTPGPAPLRRPANAGEDHEEAARASLPPIRPVRRSEAATPGPASDDVPWDYGRILKGAREDRRLTFKDWFQEFIRIIRRVD